MKYLNGFIYSVLLKSQIPFISDSEHFCQDKMFFDEKGSPLLFYSPPRSPPARAHSMGYRE